MLPVEKQMRAIRKILVRNYHKNPEHCQAWIEGIDEKLAEMREQEFIESLEEFDLDDIA